VHWKWIGTNGLQSSIYPAIVSGVICIYGVKEGGLRCSSSAIEISSRSVESNIEGGKRARSKVLEEHGDRKMGAWKALSSRAPSRIRYTNKNAFFTSEECVSRPNHADQDGVGDVFPGSSDEHVR